MIRPYGSSAAHAQAKRVSVRHSADDVTDAAQAEVDARSVEGAAVPKLKQDRLQIDDIDSFAQARSVAPSVVAPFLKNGMTESSEDSVKLAIEEILHDNGWQHLSRVPITVNS